MFLGEHGEPSFGAFYFTAIVHRHGVVYKTGHQLARRGAKSTRVTGLFGGLRWFESCVFGSFW